MSRNLGPLFEHGDEPFERAVNDLKTAAAPLVPVWPAPEPREPQEDDTLAVARAYVIAHRDKGVTCPCCDQRAQVYANAISSLQARWLAGLAAASERAHGRATEFTPLADVRITGQSATTLGGKYGKLKHWGLAEKHPKRGATWRVTTLGLEWLRGRVTVPRIVYLYDNHFRGFGTDHITYDDALRRGHDQDETMNGAAEVNP